MDDSVNLAAQQLARMRGMNAAYHQRFFSDVRFTLALELLLFAAGYAIDPRLFLAIPVVALVGAAQTAFDASYLIFSRQYATRLEQHLNATTGSDVLVAHKLEDAYLFPLDTRKVVTMPVGSPGTWFGFMTFFYTALGIGAYLSGLIAAWPVLINADRRAISALYLVSLGALTLAALVVGSRWFVGGEGERRLRDVLDAAGMGEAATATD
jgi:hypothetical protein